jgi:lipopolysaccharide transport system ATP-binding protein
MGSLRARGLGKAYKRYGRKSGRLEEWFGLGVRHEQNWVLRDISFDVGSGEAIGIVGANGAGKSTLLKILAGTVWPTTGAFEVDGRLVALLELGLGFHPDFTGRENVFIAGHLLGVRSDDLAPLMGEIEAFAEIGDHMDQPVRTYSSGMQVRLAFSVATAVRPDVLIVDEALSVGDTYFQHKSFARIRHFKEQGTTLLFVSHSAATVKTLCDRAFLLDQGMLLRDDDPGAVLDYYNALIAAQHADYEIRQTEAETGSRTTRSGTAEAIIEKVELISGAGPTRAVRIGDAITLRVSVRALSALPSLTAGILVRDRLGNDVYGTNTYHLGASLVDVGAGDRMAVDFAIPQLNLGVGSYSVTAALHARDSHTAANYDWWDRSLVFQVTAGNAPLSIGVCALNATARWVPLSPTLAGPFTRA